MNELTRQMTADVITLTGMKFFGYHGCLPEERQTGQEFFVDVNAYPGSLRAAGETDDLTKTVNYAAMYETIKGIVEGEPKNLIEAVAERIAVSLLDTYTLAGVKVTIHKPYAPIPGEFRDVSVTISRWRD